MARTTLEGLSPLYPAALRDLPNPPAELRVEGTLPDGPAMAIVGTRRADERALDFTRSLAFELGRRGVVVVSGGAKGIDRAAHEGALAAGAPTVAVLAGGLDHPFPKEHVSLFACIAEHGALVSEHPDDTVCSPGLFLARNRLVAALAVATLVVRAPIRSGALSTAAWAKKLRRPLFVAPGAPWDPSSRGLFPLLRSGASICTSAEDALSVPAFRGRTCEPPPPQTFENPRKSPRLEGDAQAVFGALDRRGSLVDEVARSLGWPIERARTALVGLTLDGLVTDDGEGHFARID
jgi:DNA processing protein